LRVEHFSLPLPISKNTTSPAENVGSLFFESKCLKKMKEKLKIVIINK